MKTREPKITAEAVRQALGELGQATWGQVADNLGLAQMDAKGREKVRLQVRDLERHQLATVCGQDGDWLIYKLTGRESPKGQVQARLWAAACIRAGKGRTLTADEGALMAGCSREYAARCFSFWQGQGFLVIRGKVASKKFGQTPLYLVAPGKEKEKPPRWNRRKEEAARKDAKAQNSDGLRVLRSKTHQALGILQEMQAEIRGMLEGTS